MTTHGLTFRTYLVTQDSDRPSSNTAQTFNSETTVPGIVYMYRRATCDNLFLKNTTKH